MYDELRFVGVTGTNAIGDVTFDATALLPQLIAQYFRARADGGNADTWTIEPLWQVPGGADDAELVAKASRSKSARAIFGDTVKFEHLWKSGRRRAREAMAGRVAAHRDAVHDPRLRRIVVDREVLRAAIVPERQRAGLPAEPAGELRPRRVLLQEVDQRLAFLVGHAVEMLHVAADIQRLAAGLRMRADQRMHDWWSARCRGPSPSCASSCRS